MRSALFAVVGWLAACHGEAPPPAQHGPLSVANLDVVWHGPIEALPRMPAVASDIDIHAGEAPWLVGDDPITHATRWRVACNNDDLWCGGRIARSGDVVIYAGVIADHGYDVAGGLFAVDVHSGRELWRVHVDLPDVWCNLVADARRAYALSGGYLYAVDLATGAMAWSRVVGDKGSRGTQLAVRDGVLAFSDAAGAIHLADPVTGRDRVTIPVDSVVGGIALRDGVLYESAGETIAAYDATNGRPLWQHVEPAAWVVPPMLVDGDAIYVRRAPDRTLAENEIGTEVVALDRGTGATLWQRAVGRATAIALIDVPAAPPMLVVDTPTEAIEFARQPAPEGPTDATITGVVRFDDLQGDLGRLRVQVGDTVVQTDATGAFTAHVRATGSVRVTLLDLPAVSTPQAAPIYADPDYVNVDRIATSPRSLIVVRQRSDD